MEGGRAAHTIVLAHTPLLYAQVHLQVEHNVEPQDALKLTAEMPAHCTDKRMKVKGDAFCADCDDQGCIGTTANRQSVQFREHKNKLFTQEA